MGVSKNRGTSKSSILIGFSIINHPFWGTTIFGNILVIISPHHTSHRAFPFASTLSSRLQRRISAPEKNGTQEVVVFVVVWLCLVVVFLCWSPSLFEVRRVCFSKDSVQTRSLGASNLEQNNNRNMEITQKRKNIFTFQGTNIPFSRGTFLSR